VFISGFYWPLADRFDARSDETCSLAGFRLVYQC
jgi:hypothetical protein